jgi:hypothetical protein
MMMVVVMMAVVMVMMVMVVVVEVVFSFLIHKLNSVCCHYSAPSPDCSPVTISAQ